MPRSDTHTLYQTTFCLIAQLSYDLHIFCQSRCTKQMTFRDRTSGRIDNWATSVKGDTTTPEHRVRVSWSEIVKKSSSCISSIGKQSRNSHGSICYSYSALMVQNDSSILTLAETNKGDSSQNPKAGSNQQMRDTIDAAWPTKSMVSLRCLT